MPNPENLTVPKKGEIRNPKGKPKGTLATKTILERFFNAKMKQKNPFTNEMEEMSVKELMVLKQLANALEGDLPSFKELLDREEGKIKQTTDITTNGENVNTTGTITVNVVENKDDEF